MSYFKGQYYWKYDGVQLWSWISGIWFDQGYTDTFQGVGRKSCRLEVALICKAL